MIQAAKVGVGPAVAYQIDPEGALVIDFVEGEVMHPDTMAGHPDRIKQVVETVKVFHDGASSSTRSISSTCCASTRRSPATSTRRCRSGSRRCSSAMEDVETATARNPVPAVACHNDLLSRELHHRRRRQDVDHRLGVRRHDRPVLRPRRLRHGAPVHARGGAAHHRHLLRRAWTSGCFGRHDALQERLRRVVGRVGDDPAHGVQIDFDYMEWGMERIARAESVVDDPDYQQWLAAQ